MLKTEIANSMVERNISNGEEAENLWIFGTAQKRTMLPSLYITLSILICFKHKKSVFSEFDNKDDDKDEGR